MNAVRKQRFLQNHEVFMVENDFVVQTHPCSEALAKGNLEAKGFVVYLPTVIEEIRSGRRREQRTTVMAPLFPGYLFVRLSLGDRDWSEIGSAGGVKRMLPNNEHPKPIPDGALDDLRARFDAGEFVRKVSNYRINAGDAVTVTEGAFQGHTGVCTVSRGERIKVMLARLWGALEVEMPVAMVVVS
jgi:transcriptional antiterminator RfaH